MDKGKLVKVDFGGKNCEIQPFEGPLSPAMMPGYKKMEVSDSQKGRISALCGQIPDMMEANVASNAYILRWHDGIPHDLAHYKDGVAFQPVARNADGQIEAWMELYPATSEAVLLYGFTAMSIVTGQYFLAEINHQMKVMNQSIDKILEFLYGDKKAELISELSFARYAHQNFSSIMEHNVQRAAMIQSILEGRKTAIKDVEFYLADLYSTVNAKDKSDVEALAHRAFQIRECLELSMQLYVTCNVLEVFYSQNFDSGYLKHVENDVGNYISKCEKQMLGDFNFLRAVVESAKQPKIGKKFNQEDLLKSINLTIDRLAEVGEPEIKKALHRALYSSERASEYCISTDGNIYLKLS